MGFKVTLKWSSDASSLSGNDGSTLTRVFTVTGTNGTRADVFNTLTAVDDLDANMHIPSIGNAFDAQNLYFRCFKVDPRPVGFGVIEVTVQYGVAVPTPPNANPTQQPVVVTKDDAEVEEQADHDIDGLALVNLCNNPFRERGTRTVKITTITLTKYLISYPGSIERTYSNSVNNDDFTLPLFGQVKKNYCRFVSLVPAAPMRLNDPYYPIRLTLQIYDLNAPDHPWQYRILNQGCEAYGYDSNSGDTTPQKGLITLYNSDETVTQDVPLDINGMPIDQDAYGIKGAVGKGSLDTFAKAPDAAKILKRFKIPPDTSVDGCVFLRNRKCFQRSFASLLSALNMNS